MSDTPPPLPSPARIRTLAVAGLCGTLIWVGLGISPRIAWGAPGTHAYDAYEATNRMWAPAFALMAGAYGALLAVVRPTANRALVLGLGMVLAGLAVMIAGSIAEFWLFSSVPYDQADFFNSRNLSWFAFLAGLLILLIGATIAGVAALSIRAAVWWVCLPLALILPLTVLGFAVDAAWLPLAVAAATSGAHAVRRTLP